MSCAHALGELLLWWVPCAYGGWLFGNVIAILLGWKHVP